MPIFEYHCPKCQANFEKLVKNSAEKVECPECGSKDSERQLSRFSATVAAPKSSCSVSDCASCCPSGTCGLQ